MPENIFFGFWEDIVILLNRKYKINLDPSITFWVDLKKS